MRITFAYPVRVLDADADAESSAWRTPFIFPMNGPNLATFLDSKLADEGVIGGDVCLVLTDSLPSIVITYWMPHVPERSVIEDLQADTAVQLEDGFGEGGFEVDVNGQRLVFVADIDEAAEVEITDDGRPVPGRPFIAIAARDGDMPALQAAINAHREAVNRLHQGCSPLQLAMLFGHAEMVAPLLAAGADPNQLDEQGHNSLEICALSNAMTDEQSRDIAQLLLAAGADRQHQAPNGETAKTYAVLRDKPLTAAIL